jgi:hypothetical protein
MPEMKVIGRSLNIFGLFPAALTTAAQEIHPGMMQ